MGASEAVLGFMQWEPVASLVGSIRTRALVARPTSAEQCREALAWAREHDLTVCTRGSGRSYGDLPLNHDQVILDLSGMKRILAFDEAKAQITVEAGTRLIDIFAAVHHRRLTLPSSPTESHSAVAGAIAANVNGKDSWRFGSFAHQVVRFSLMLADGSVIEVDRDHELFDAVVGGIGLIGVILDATVQLQPIPSPWVEITQIPAPDVDALLARMAEVEKTHDAAVVWVDAYASGPRIGRSVIHAAKWVERQDSEAELRPVLEAGYERLADHRRMGLALHAWIGPLLSLLLQAQRPLVSLFNRLYYFLHQVLQWTGRNRKRELFLRFSFEASFTVPPAHIVCGPHGYAIQLTFPRNEAREALVELLGICQDSPCPPVTTILRAHKKDDALLSFSEDGYSLNFEFHPKARHAAAGRAMVDRLFDATARRGGKIHLAKDQMLRPEQFRRIYPRHAQLLEIKRKLDPENRFTSNLARRVGLVDH